MLSAVLSMGAFVILWAIVTDAWNYSALLFSSFLPASGKFIYACISRILWMAPAFLLICRLDHSLFWHRRQLFSKPKAEPLFLAFLVLTSVYVFGAMLIRYHAWHITGENIRDL